MYVFIFLIPRERVGCRRHSGLMYGLRQVPRIFPRVVYLRAGVDDAAYGVLFWRSGSGGATNRWLVLLTHVVMVASLVVGQVDGDN